MHTLALDLRFAFRQLRKAPGFSLVVILTFAIGIGATTAIFSLVEGVLLRPLPFSEYERLVLLGDHLGDNPNTSVTAREILSYTNSSGAFSSVGGFTLTTYEVSGGATPQQVYAARLTAGVLPTLGVQPVIGRVFTQKEEDTRQPLAVISYALWLSRYHRDPKVLGVSIDLDRKSYTVIGVMPRSFEFPLQTGRLTQAQVWVPMSLSPDELSDEQEGFWGYQMVARLKDGVTFAQAAQDADRVAKQTMRTFPPSMSAIRIKGDVVPLREFLISDTRPVLRTLFFAVVIVLLIACVNVSGLLLVRAIRRRREYAVRLALGARSRVIIRESIFEGMLLSLAGGMLGLGVAAVAIRTALHLLPESMPRIDEISVNATVALFAMGVALVSGTVCGLAPAFAALKTDLTESLKEGDRTSTGGSSHTWLRSALVVSEISVALILLTTSGAFLRSFQKMRQVDPGFRPNELLVAGYQLPLNQYPTNASANNFNREVVRRLSAKPGIVSAGVANTIPATGAAARAAYTIEGQRAETWKLVFSNFALVDGNYFGSMGIPLIEGRYLNENDQPDKPLVVVVNQSMAKHSWPGQSPLGKRMHVGNPNKGYPWATVVGVVADTKTGARDEPTGDQWFASLQQPAILFGTQYAGTLTAPAGGFITLRSLLPPEQMVQTLRSTVAEIDPLLALDPMQTMNDALSGIEAPRRFNTDLITAFAAGALLLAVTGIYAVVAFTVSLRIREMAIRMTLGAQRRDITKLVLNSGAKLALLGCAIGVAGSIAVSQVVSSFLFQVSAIDPMIYGAGVVIMLVMALLASMLPAARAARVEPVEALRAG